MSRSSTSESAVEECTTTNSSLDNTSRESEIDTYSDKNSRTGSELSGLAYHALRLETRARDLAGKCIKTLIVIPPVTV